MQRIEATVTPAARAEKFRGTVWGWSRRRLQGNPYVAVDRDDGNLIEVVLNTRTYSFRRRDARHLANLILRCLEDTR